MRTPCTSSAHRCPGLRLKLNRPPLPQFHHCLRSFLRLVIFVCLIPCALAQTIIHVPVDQPTIQAGIDAASNGDTVLVAPGTYYENIDFKGKSITVTSSKGALTTILDGSYTPNQATVLFQSGESRSSVISNFTIQNGGVGARGSSYGGVYVVGASPTILNNIIQSNGCNGVYVDTGTALIQGNTISNSLGPSGNDRATYSFCFLPGSGILLVGNGSNNCEIIGNTIEGNLLGGLGGGILAYGVEGTLIRNNIIRNNVAANGSAIGSYSTQAITIDGNLIYGNRSNGSYQYTGAVSLTNFVSLAGPVLGFITNNTIVGNSTTNFSSTASEVYLAASSAQYSFVNNVIVGMTKFPALYCAAQPGQGVEDPPMPTDHNDVFNPGGPASAGDCIFAAGTNGNLSVDPLLTADYHPGRGSPVIDAGNTSVLPLTPTDLDGNPRVLDGTGLGYAVIDMGTYEHTGVQPPIQTILTVTPSMYEQQSITPITLTVQLSSPAGPPIGDSISFLSDGVVFSTGTIDASGVATATTASLTEGMHLIVASYSGHAPHSSAVSVPFFIVTGQPIIPTSTTTTLTASPISPTAYGQSVTFTAVVTGASSTAGAPTGSIVFTDGTAPLSTQPLASASSTTATATFSTGTLYVGTHIITATYAPTGNFVASIGTVTQTVTALTPAITFTSSPNPQFTSLPVNLAVTVTGSSTNPSGTVVFSYGTSTLATVSLDTAGKATIPFTFLPGTYTLTASYSGNAIYSPAVSAAVTEVILPSPADFTIALASPSLTVQTQHHLTTSVTLTSLNGFTDSIALGCVNPPTYVTCRFTPTPATLTANGTATVSLYLDTDSVLGYARLQPTHIAPTSPIDLALLFSPLGFFAAIAAGRGKRRRPGLFLFSTLLAIAPLALFATGCSTLIEPYDVPPSAAPGTYTLSIAATGAATGITHTAQLTLAVTP